jgi:ankyrin repeat protein
LDRLESGVSINARDRIGTSALMYAVQRGNPEVIQLLLDRGADLDFQNSYGFTALTYAAMLAKGPEHDPRPLRMLLAAGA